MAAINFLSMGGYGSYVWSSWILTVVVLLVLIMLPYRQQKQLKRQIAEQIRRQQLIGQKKGCGYDT